MSNIIPFGSNTALPAYLQQGQFQSSMGTMGDAAAGGRRVQCKGGQINFLAEDGKPMGVVQNQDGTVTTFPQYSNSAEIIILGMLPHDSIAYRAWYAKAYVEGDSSAPDCWSADGVSPSPKSAQAQSATCKDCPKNVAGTSSTGKGKACSSRKRLAVVYANDPELRVFSLDLPSTALFGKSAREAEQYFTLAGYTRFLKTYNAIWEAVVTEVCFAEGSTIGVRFKAKGYIDQATFQRVMELKAHDDVHRALEIDFPAAKVETAETGTAYQSPIPPAPTAVNDKSAMLANPAFQTTLAHLAAWAQNPAVTAELIRAEAAKYGINL